MRAGEDREELEGRRHLVLDDVEAAALAVAVVAVDAGAEHQLALVRLADVDVDRVRHHHDRVDRLEQLRDQRLERMALERQPDAGHRRPRSRRGRPRRWRPCRRAIVPRDVRTPVTRPPSMSMPVTSAPSIRSTPRSSAARAYAPRDVVVLGDPAARLVGRAEDRVADVRRHVDDRAEALDVVGRQPFGVDAVEAIGVDPPLALAHVAAGCGRGSCTPRWLKRRS